MKARCEEKEREKERNFCAVYASPLLLLLLNLHPRSSLSHGRAGARFRGLRSRWRAVTSWIPERLDPSGHRARGGSAARAPAVDLPAGLGWESPWRGSGWSRRPEQSSYCGRFPSAGSSPPRRSTACLRAPASRPLSTATGGAGTCSWCSPTPTTSPCMFFSPTILFLESKGHKLHVLCMSLGNADGFGDTRKEELYNACATLKIPAEQVAVLDHQNLQDGFHEEWDHGLLAELTMEQIQLWDIDTIVTFDSYGVSGHPNHRDVHHGICKLLHENQQENIEAWELVSLNMFRKYSGAVEIWLSPLISSSSKQLV
ncbi:N-acetylglucosaminyl-phosphatidylinositol de-N-acetylase isoform X3 [Triticum aestivum]|uniref:N-acetylglucosaminyl-phosphatidylinositol de-N-acetylase isoform X3 n=2 Tax=Triticum aestivum TaxID=4565 RepID=UPI001D01E736|nr:N-acetylglucosaminyl-phosphatidylinositol de-N-acetylase-like isoform X3 [Triticum aestivum]